MRYAPVAMALMALCFGTLAFGGQNPSFTLPMHGIFPFTFQENCATPGQRGINCDTVLPETDIGTTPGQAIVYLFVYNHNELKGCATKFEWDGWTPLIENWACQTNPLSLSTPLAPGANGLLSTSFDCVTDPALQVVGWMVFNVPGSGCISQTNTPEGNVQALDCNLALDTFDATVPGNENRLGMICQGPGGRDGCEGPAPVEPTTWGSVKAQYR